MNVILSVCNHKKCKILNKIDIKDNSDLIY